MSKFTREEKIALVFLVGVMLLGTALYSYKRLVSAPYNFPAFGKKETRPKEKININTAGVRDLMQLPNIGPALAERIVVYREGHGPFLTPEDIKKVKGIGDKTYRKIEENITLE